MTVCPCVRRVLSCLSYKNDHDPFYCCARVPDHHYRHSFFPLKTVTHFNDLYESCHDLYLGRSFQQPFIHSFLTIHIPERITVPILPNHTPRLTLNHQHHPQQQPCKQHQQLSSSPSSSSPSPSQHQHRASLLQTPTPTASSHPPSPPHQSAGHPASCPPPSSAPTRL